MIVRLTQIDGKFPNLALMRLAAWHRSCGDDIHFTTQIRRDVTEPRYDVIYGSAIFAFSTAKVQQFRWQWPGAIVGGTGTGESHTVEQVVGRDFRGLDYSLYPSFKASIGFTQRGCRFACGHCCVPGKEGPPTIAATIADIWRGDGHDRKLLLLDNDFFGQPRTAWKARVAEIIEGDFAVCLCQGVNLRVLTREQAEALASMKCRDTKFSRRRIYTAWDDIRDEGDFLRGLDLLKRAGVPMDAVMAYMLVGYDPAETWDAIWHRFDTMRERGTRPFVMVYDRGRTDLRAFARWVNMGLYRCCSWADYQDGRKAGVAA